MRTDQSDKRVHTAQVSRYRLHYKHLHHSPSVIENHGSDCQIEQSIGGVVIKLLVIDFATEAIGGIVESKVTLGDLVYPVTVKESLLKSGSHGPELIWREEQLITTEL